MARILVAGEILFDRFPDRERLGGASFNFAVHARHLGHEVLFYSAVGRDEPGARAFEAARRYGLDTQVLQLADLATGAVDVTLGRDGSPSYHLHRPAAYDAIVLDDTTIATIAGFSPDWLYFGTLHQIIPQVHRAMLRLMDLLPQSRRFYDVNLRPDCWTPQLVSDLLARASVVKLNEDEASELAWQPHGNYAITRGAKGCTVSLGPDIAHVPAPPISVVDTVGAGDAFAAAFLHGVIQGWPAARIGEFANAAGARIASQSGALPE